MHVSAMLGLICEESTLICWWCFWCLVKMFNYVYYTIIYTIPLVVGSQCIFSKFYLYNLRLKFMILPFGTQSKSSICLNVCYMCPCMLYNIFCHLYIGQSLFGQNAFLEKPKVLFHYFFVLSGWGRETKANIILGPS